MMKCLLDLDNVLVDFIEGACQLHNVPNPYEQPENRGKPRLEELVGINKEYFFGKMGEQFWTELRRTRDCYGILRIVESVFGRENVCLATSPIKTKGCADGKIAWIERHLPYYGENRRYLIGYPKEFAAGPDTWLVDDSNENVQKFRGRGGNAVMVPALSNCYHNLVNCIPGFVRDHLPESQVV